MSSDAAVGHVPLRVCFPFEDGFVGGSHVSALKLIQSLPRGRVTPVVVLQNAGGPVASFLMDNKQPFVSLEVGRTLSPRQGAINGLGAYLARTLPHLRRFIRTGRFDIVHTNDGRSHVNWGLAARLTGAKLVWHHRGDPSAKGANWLAPLIADHVVTVSRFASPSRPVCSLEQRLSVIHSPFDQPASVDREQAKHKLLSELGLQPGTRVLSYVGNLVERKRPALFVEAVAHFHRQHPEIPVVGCVFGQAVKGRPEAETAARARASALGVDQHIRFMGFRSPIEPYLAATDILLVPAVGEPFGRTLIEAMFLGTPVVATRHGGNVEAVQHERTGILVEPECATAFVEPVARLLTEPALWTRISWAAEDYALRTFSAARHAEEVMKVYGRVIRPGMRTVADAKLSESIS